MPSNFSGPQSDAERGERPKRYQVTLYVTQAHTIEVFEHDEDDAERAALLAYQTNQHFDIDKPRIDFDSTDVREIVAGEYCGD